MNKRWLLNLYRILKEFNQKEIYEKYRNQYEIDEKFRFNGEDIIFYGEGEIRCNESSYIGAYSTIQSSKGNKVIIGKGCQISHNVRIYSQSANADQNFEFYDSSIAKKGDVVIGDYVWIGANVMINPNLKIGNNSVLGANSVVTKDVEPFTIVGGVPAKLIRYKKCNEKR
jgi:maltose O-acetyltransferase